MADKNPDLDDDEDDLPEGKAEGGKVEAEADDEKVAAAPEDARLNEDPEGDEDGESGDQKRERRRQERVERKRRQREARDADRREIALLRRTVADLSDRVNRTDTGVQQTQLAQIDSHLTQAKQVETAADAQLRDAMTSQDGDSFSKALKARDEARLAINQLSYAKQQIEAGRQTQGPQARPNQPDPRLMQNYNSWRSKHSWYDPQGGDEDSQIASAIDRTVAAAGYDPTTQDYWAELDRRLARRLPERFGQTPGTPANQPKQRRSAPVGGAPSLTNGNREQTLSTARENAIAEAAGNDPAKAKRIRDAMKQHDKDNRPAR